MESFLHGWFEMRFYANFVGYISLFGNNFGEMVNLENGHVSQEMGTRLGENQTVNSPAGSYHCNWRQQGEIRRYVLYLRIEPMEGNASAFRLFWTGADNVNEFEGVGNLIDGHRMLGWYREVRNTSLNDLQSSSPV